MCSCCVRAACCAAGRIVHPIPCALRHPPASVLFGSRETSPPFHPGPALDTALAVGYHGHPLPLLRTHSSAGHRLRGTRTPNTGGFQLCPLKLAALPPAGVVGTESPPDDTRHRHRATSTGAWRCSSPHRKRSLAEQRLPQRLFPTGMSPRTGGVWGPRACAGPPPARPAPGIGRGRRGGGGGDAAPASRRRSPSAARPSLNTPGRGARSSRELPGAASRARGSGSGCRGTAPPGARPAAAYAGAAGPGEPWTAAAAGCRPPWRRTRRS